MNLLASLIMLLMFWGGTFERPGSLGILGLVMLGVAVHVYLVCAVGQFAFWIMEGT